MKTLCGKYLGDNDATSPELTCIRRELHAGPCDNVRGDELLDAIEELASKIRDEFQYNGSPGLHRDRMFTEAGVKAGVELARSKTIEILRSIANEYFVTVAGRTVIDIAIEKLSEELKP